MTIILFLGASQNKPIIRCIVTYSIFLVSQDKYSDFQSTYEIFSVCSYSTEFECSIFELKMQKNTILVMNYLHDKSEIMIDIIVRLQLC